METLFENRYTVNLRMLRSFSRGASLLSAISSW